MSITRCQGGGQGFPLYQCTVGSSHFESVCAQMHVVAVVVAAAAAVEACWKT